MVQSAICLLYVPAAPLAGILRNDFYSIKVNDIISYKF